MSKPHTYTAQYLGKWHSGFNVGNLSFVLQAFEGTEEEAKWYAEMMDKAFAKLRVEDEVKINGRFTCSGCGTWCGEDSDGFSVDALHSFCPGCGNKIKRTEQ